MLPMIEVILFHIYSSHLDSSETKKKKKSRIWPEYEILLYEFGQIVSSES